MVVVVDDQGVGGPQGVLPQVPLGRPGQHLIGDAGGLGHPDQAQVGGLGDQTGVDVADQLGAAGHLAPGVHQGLGEADPVVHLDQQRGQPGPGQQLHQLLPQPVGVCGDRLGRQGRDHKLALLGEPDGPGAAGEHGLQVFEVVVQLGFGVRPGLGGVG